MQWNQPFGSVQTNPKTVPPNPQILGEGDVTAITFPDGSVQLYFVPLIRQDYLPFHCNSFCSPNNTQAWFVRSIVYPQINFSVQPGYFNNQAQCSFRECPLTPCPSVNNYENTLTYPPYLQKFHNDVWTSTTDIVYFYPNLGQKKYLFCCTETQTEMLFQNNNLCQNIGCNIHCLTRPGLGPRVSEDIKCTCHQIKSSVSCMSVDSDKNVSEPRKKHDKSRVKNKNTIKKVHYCECKPEIMGTSDKFVTTFVDTGTDYIANNGCETQTENSRSKTKLRAPNKRKTPKSNSPIKIIGTCQSYSSSSCSCNGPSTSDTDGK